MVLQAALRLVELPGSWQAPTDEMPVAQHHQDWLASAVHHRGQLQVQHNGPALTGGAFSCCTATRRNLPIARQMFCNEKATKEKVMKRDLAVFVGDCMEAIERAEQAIKK